jgi:alkylated DNA repair dioxygenase AlkB
MGWHSDNEPELGLRPTIASLSFGTTRELLFKNRNKEISGIRKIPLTHGSLLVMSGDTQANWLHGINKDAKEKQQRINLTFRFIRPNARR